MLLRDLSRFKSPKTIPWSTRKTCRCWLEKTDVLPWKGFYIKKNRITKFVVHIQEQNKYKSFHAGMRNFGLLPNFRLFCCPDLRDFINFCPIWDVFVHFANFFRFSHLFQAFAENLVVCLFTTLITGIKQNGCRKHISKNGNNYLYVTV